jgi:hypothetical protein
MPLYIARMGCCLEGKAAMEPPVLTDKDQFPTEEIIYSHIGKAKTLWLSVLDYIHSSHPDIVEQWRYYNDGRSWLLNASRKKKTVFWLSVSKGTFRTTCYFSGKASQAVEESSLSADLKQQYRENLHGAKIHRITITYRKKSDIENFKKLIAIKLSMK